MECSYVWSETWTINSLDRKRIEAFEMWCYRRMLKIRWVEHITNEEVLNRIGREGLTCRTVVQSVGELSRDYRDVFGRKTS